MKNKIEVWMANFWETLKAEPLQLMAMFLMGISVICQFAVVILLLISKK